MLYIHICIQRYLSGPFQGGYASIVHAAQDCPAEYRDFVFQHLDGTDRGALAWHRVKEFQLCALKLIASAMLVYSSKEGAAGSTPRGGNIAGRSDGTGEMVPAQASGTIVLDKPRAARLKTVDLCLANEVSFADLSFEDIVPLLYASPHNSGADKMVRALGLTLLSIYIHIYMYVNFLQ